MGLMSTNAPPDCALDIPEGAYAKRPSGHVPVKPGDPNHSAIIERVTMKGPLHMPPASTGHVLTAAQIATLRLWIQQGGEYKPHWAFIAPKRPLLPTTTNKTWAKNAIDTFILARLEHENLFPSPSCRQTNAPSPRDPSTSPDCPLRRRKSARSCGIRRRMPMKKW